MISYLMKLPNYIVITPVRNEAAHVTSTIESMTRQTIIPKKWIIVDDGSTDKTPQIIDAASNQHSWIHVLHRPDRGFRRPGGGVIQAFYDGYSNLGDVYWDFLVKLDADLSFEPDYFERCLDYFASEPELGIGGGMVCSSHNGELREESIGDPPFHVRGATKIYRRACWKQIEPLIQAPGWDTVDEVKANMKGWSTRTFRDVPVVQLKATGCADGSWQNWFKNGLANYITGYHPLFMLAKCLKRSLQKPYFTASMGLCAGFASGYLKQIPRPESANFIRYLRQQQISRIFQRPSIYG